jgi:integrase
MLFWTKDEYTKFSEAMMDKPLSYYAFEMLYWCGIRLGELLALTYGDFDFEKQTVRINKSYQCIKGKDVVTTPKTKKSNRLRFTHGYSFLYSFSCTTGVSLSVQIYNSHSAWRMT